jgi:uncharacterized protein YceK
MRVDCMKRIALTLTILGAALLSACGTVRIARINADPSRYRNRDASVEGSVTTSFGVLGTAYGTAIREREHKVRY